MNMSSDGGYILTGIKISPKHKGFCDGTGENHPKNQKGHTTNDEGGSTKRQRV